MTSLNQLATRLRLNAASMEHGDAEADIRAAADILDSFADAGEIEYAENQVTIKGALNDDSRAQIEALATELAAKF